jgi:hypothetical protein
MPLGFDHRGIEYCMVELSKDLAAGGGGAKARLPFMTCPCPHVTIDIIRTRHGMFLTDWSYGLLLSCGRDILFYVCEREGVFYADSFWRFL